MDFLRRERPQLLSALGEAAWSAGAIDEDYSRTAADLLALDPKLQQAKEVESAAAVTLREAEDRLGEAEREVSSKIEAAAQPVIAAERDYERLRDRSLHLKQTIANHKRTIPMLTSSAENLEKKIAELEGLAEAESRVARLQSDLQRRRQDATESEKRLQEAEKDLASLQPDLEAMERDLEGKRAELKKQEAKLRERLGILVKERDEARERHRESDTVRRALQDSFEPLFYQLGEELNVRRLEHDALSDHYLSLDEQLLALRDLYMRLSTEEANLAAIDKNAALWFWGLAVGSGLLVVLLLVLIIVLVL